MKIAALRLHNVRRFAGRGVALENIGDGVNVLCAANEQGKSTSFEALHALFFSPHGSAARDVQSLRPYSGGNSLVEADVETASGRYRLTKRFHGSKLARVTDLTNGRLIAQADEAEAFIAELVQGGIAGPAGLLWVRQGLTGIEERSKKDEENEKTVRAGLLESVQGEVEAVTGGRRMSEVRDRVEAELERLITAKGKPKANEAYAIALAEVDKITAEEARLADDVKRLRADLDKRAETMRLLRESDVPELQQVEDAEIAEAQARLDAARANQQALETAEAKLALITRDRDTVSAELAAFENNIRREDELARKVTACETARTAAQEKRDQIRTLRSAASTRRDAAAAADKAARTAVQALERHRRAADARERLLRAESSRDQAEALRTEIESNEAEAARLAISDTDIAALATAEQALFRQQTLAEMARPAVTFRYAAGQAPNVRLNGERLPEGERRSFDGAAEIDIENVGTLHVETAIAAGGLAALRDAETRFAALLAKIGVTSVAEARQRHRDADTARNGAQQAREKLKILAPQGLSVLLKEIATLRADAQAPDDPSLSDESAILAAHDAAQRELDEADAALKAMAAGEDPANDAFARAEAELAARTSEWNAIHLQLGPPASRDERRAALLDTFGRLTGEAESAQQTVTTLRAQSADVGAATARLNRLKSAADSRRKQIADLKVTLAGLEAAIRTQADLAVEERWNEVRDLLAQAQQRAAAYAKEVEVLTTLRDALDAARTRARDTYLSPVIGELRPLLGLLFDDVGIEFDEKTLLPTRLTRNGLHEDVDRLSGGMREQLSILTRLAFARLLAQDGRPAPVILDDALVYSDDDRIEKMFDALHRQASNQQIIVFSCRQRAFQRLGGNVLTITGWVPPDL